MTVLTPNAGEVLSIDVKTVSEQKGLDAPRLCMRASTPDGRCVDLTSRHDLHPEATLAQAVETLTAWAEKINSDELCITDAWLEISLPVRGSSC